MKSITLAIILGASAPIALLIFVLNQQN